MVMVSSHGHGPFTNPSRLNRHSLLVLQCSAVSMCKCYLVVVGSATVAMQEPLRGVLTADGFHNTDTAEASPSPRPLRPALWGDPDWAILI